MTGTLEQGHRVIAVTDKGVGETIRQRRVALGMDIKDLAQLAGVDRGRLSKIEEGANARPSTIGAIQAALTKVEQETSGPYDEDQAQPAAGMVTFRMSGNFGVDVTVQGPVSDLDELEAAVERLLGKMRSPEPPAS